VHTLEGVISVEQLTGNDLFGHIHQ